MMMMSSNTVGNHDFNTAGITPFDVKKPQAKKEATLKLANAKADSFERTPRDTAPEVTTKPLETASPAGGKSGLVGAVLGGLALATSFGFGWMAFSHGKAAEEASKLAKAAQKEASELRTQVTTLGKGLTPAEIEAKIGIAEKAIKDTLGKHIIDLEEELKIVKQRSLDNSESITDGINLSLINLKDRASFLENNQAAQEILNERLIDDVTNLQRVQLNQSRTLQNLEDDIHPKVAGKDVSSEVRELFNPTQNPEKFAETDFAKAVEAYTNPAEGTPQPSSLGLIQDGLNSLDAKTPGALKRFFLNLPNYTGATVADADSYSSQLDELKLAVSIITKVFDQETTSADFLENDVYNTLVQKAQAVVDAASQADDSPAKVKTAQTELVEELKNQFGKSRTDQFEAYYPKAVRGFTPPPNKEATNGWVLEHFEPEKSFDHMAEVILTGGLNGHDESNNTVKSADALATVVLHNLVGALVKAYPEETRISNTTGALRYTEKYPIPLNHELGNLVNTLEGFKQALQPITKDALEASANHPFHETSTEDLAKLTDSQQLLAKMINARLKGNTEEGKAQMETVTEEMYNKLREDLQALNKAKSTVVPDVVNSVLNIPGLPADQSVIDALMDKTPITDMLKPSIKDSLKEVLLVKVKDEIEDTNQQNQLTTVFFSLFNAKKDDNLVALLSDQGLTEPLKVNTAFETALTELLNPERPSISSTDIQNEMFRLFDVIKANLPPAKDS
ncbi:MAG: hypothetical protein H2174_03865 [Vampirovibrio sp.]|nr:hypothetical protein [Vampirovibrio sp.]